MNKLTLYRKFDNKISQHNSVDKSYSNWQKEKEHFLFISAHDDDIAMGSGLFLQKAVEENIPITILITTDGSMGYGENTPKDEIIEVRKKETINSFNYLGIHDVHWLNFPDCDTGSYTGRRKAKPGDPCIIENYTGLQNSFTKKIREINPSRIFLPAGSDLHPDHQIVYQEVLISIFHASGDIWPELGKPIKSIPDVYEMAVYCDFPSPPNIKVKGEKIHLDKKLKALGAYKSQKQIKILVDKIRKGGPVEYFRDIVFNLYSPDNYKDIF